MSRNESHQVHGTNPQFLIEKIIRSRIYDSLYWKESCFGLNCETLLEKAVVITEIGGLYSNQKPVDFLCLLLKLLQLQPENEIILFFLEQTDYKYLRALAALYLRIVGKAVQIYSQLEILLEDNRKLRLRTASGYILTTVDEFADNLLRLDRYCDTILPRITKRYVLEDLGEIEPRVSSLEREIEDQELLALEPEEMVDDVTQEPKNDSVPKEFTISKKKVKNLFKNDYKPEIPLDMGSEKYQGGSASAGGDDSLSIEETNKLRMELGLKPLKG